MIHGLKIEPGMKLKLVEPNFDKLRVSKNAHHMLREGACYIVRRVLQPSIILMPEEEPETHFHVKFASGYIHGFSIHNPHKDQLEKTAGEIHSAVKDYHEQYGDRIEEFTQRQRTPQEREDDEKRKELAQKLLNMRKKEGGSPSQ